MGDGNHATYAPSTHLECHTTVKHYSTWHSLCVVELGLKLYHKTMSLVTAWVYRKLISLLRSSNETVLEYCTYERKQKAYLLFDIVNRKEKIQVAFNRPSFYSHSPRPKQLCHYLGILGCKWSKRWCWWPLMWTGLAVAGPLFSVTWLVLLGHWEKGIYVLKRCGKLLNVATYYL